MIAGLFGSTQGCDYIPNALRQFYTAPLDKAGGNRARSAKKRRIAPLSPLIKLLDFIKVRRLRLTLGGWMSAS